MMPDCLVCGGRDLEEFFELLSVPVLCNVLHEARSAARDAEFREIRLAVCHTCGHVLNVSFDPAAMRYATGYENSLHGSPTFQRYAEALARRLVGEFRLTGKAVIEIGCGRGEFLDLLVAAGAERGIGYDPSYDPAADAPRPQVTIRTERCPDRLVEQEADFVCARHVLEHVHDPVSLLRSLSRAAGDRSVGGYVEVPNGDHLLREVALWDVIYEHPSHFTSASLSRALEAGGFAIRALSPAFGGQYLAADLTCGPAGTKLNAGGGAAEQVVHAARHFTAGARRLLERWAHELDRLYHRGARTFVWGAGAKGVTFANVLPCAAIEALVDVNPRKWGRHVPGSGHPVVAPHSLPRSQPDAVLVLNPLYVAEIRKTLSDLDVRAEVISVRPGAAA